MLLKCFWGLGMGKSGSEERKISAVPQVGERKVNISNIWLRNNKSGTKLKEANINLCVSNKTKWTQQLYLPPWRFLLNSWFSAIVSSTGILPFFENSKSLEKIEMMFQFPLCHFYLSWTVFWHVTTPREFLSCPDRQ